MNLTLEDANRMVAAAMAKARQMNVKMSVAVVDAGGHLLAFNRMEGAVWVSASVAQGKATAANAFGRPSGSVQAESPIIQTIINGLGGKLLPARGGLPLFRDGDLVGGIGASGATAEQDEECAKVGAAAL